MSEAQRVQRELQEISEILQNMPADPEPYTAEWFNHRSMLRRQSALLAQLDSSEVEAFEVSVTGAPVRNDAIEGGFAGQLLDKLQSTVLAIAQSIRGRPTTRAPVPREFVEMSRLMITGTAVGSFRWRFAPPERHTSMFDEQEHSLLDDSISALMDVCEVVEGSEGIIARTTEPLGPRAVSHLQSMSRLLAGAGADATFIHRPTRDSPVRRAGLSSAKAQQLEEVLSRQTSSERTIRLRGRLVGASWHREYFDLEVRTAGGEKAVYQGHVDPLLRDRVDELFDQEVDAVLIARQTSRNVAGEDRWEYELHQIEGVTND